MTVSKASCKQSRYSHKTDVAERSFTERWYTVRNGDCLWTVAQEQLGSVDRYKEIVKLNRLKTSVIKSGQRLRVPTN